MLFALADGSAVITDDHLSAALAVWDACARSAAHIFGSGTGDHIADKILASLRDALGGMTRTEVRRNAFSDHEPAARVKAALQSLLSNGLIRQEIDRGTGGAPAARFFAVAPREKRGKRYNPPPEETYHANHAYHAHAAKNGEASRDYEPAGREVFVL
jgi:hypothetical protein